MTAARVEHWHDIEYTAEFNFFKDDPASCTVEFRIWNDIAPDAPEPPDHTGFAKWDGCVNFAFDADGLPHFCNLRMLRRFCTMTERVYQTAGKMLADAGTVDGDCFTDMSGN